VQLSTLPLPPISLFLAYFSVVNEGPKNSTEEFRAQHVKVKVNLYKYILTY